MLNVYLKVYTPLNLKVLLKIFICFPLLIPLKIFSQSINNFLTIFISYVLLTIFLTNQVQLVLI